MADRVKTGVITAGGQFPDQGRRIESFCQIISIRLFFPVGISGKDKGNSVFGTGSAADGIGIEGEVLKVSADFIRIRFIQVVEKVAVKGIQYKYHGVVFRRDGKFIFHGKETAAGLFVTGIVLYQENTQGDQLCN